MKKSFKNANQLECIFTEEGVSFYGAKQQATMPYGCIDYIKMSLMGILEAGSGKHICSMAIDRKDRAEVKEMIRYARDTMKTAPKAEPQVIGLTAADEKTAVPSDLSPEEQLKKYKALFIQGAISKEEYDARKLQLKP